MVWQARDRYDNAHFYWQKETSTSNEIQFYLPFGGVFDAMEILIGGELMYCQCIVNKIRTLTKSDQVKLTNRCDGNSVLDDK